MLGDELADHQPKSPAKGYVTRMQKHNWSPPCDFSMRLSDVFQSRRWLKRPQHTHRKKSPGDH